MLQFLKMRIVLIGLAILALAACADSSGADRASARVDAADPGTAPYPNLGAFPSVPKRPATAQIEAQERQLVDQREAAKAFDARLRAIDPVLDPAARPPEPPSVASVVGVQPAAASASAANPAAPQARPAIAAVSPLPSAVAPPPQVAVPQPVPPASIATPRPVSRTVRPVATALPSPAATTGSGARTGWIIGEISFAEGSAILSAESRRTLRDAVVAAQERGGRVRITPTVAAGLSPPDQALSPRRAAAASGELEALGLDRGRILIDPGAMLAARVAVEF